jgi:hypothetical protein
MKNEIKPVSGTLEFKKLKRWTLYKTSDYKAVTGYTLVTSV